MRYALQVCLAKPDSDRPETTIDQTLFREPPPIADLVHYIPEFPVIRYPIHQTIYGFNPIYRIQLDGNVLGSITDKYADNEVQSLDLCFCQYTPVQFEQGRERDAYDQHLVD